MERSFAPSKDIQWPVFNRDPVNSWMLNPNNFTHSLASLIAEQNKLKKKKDLIFVITAYNSKKVINFFPIFSQTR